jgi:hypothetical protein
MVEASATPEGVILWTAEYLWPASLAGVSLALRRRIALERLAAVVDADTGIGADLAMRRAAEILGHVAEA